MQSNDRIEMSTVMVMGSNGSNQFRPNDGSRGAGALHNRAVLLLYSRIILCITIKIN